MALIYYNVGESLGVPDLSPFCLKLESFMRLHDIDFTISDLDIRKKLSMAPKKKVPFVKFENGELMGDSALIIARLAKDNDIDLYAGLSAQQKAIGHSIIRMLDEHFYFCLVYARWVDDRGWAVMEPLLFHEAPGFIRGFISNMVRKKTSHKLWEQGISRHSADDVYAIGAKDIQALSDILGDDGLFFGASAPSLVDLCVHSYLANILYVDIENGLRDEARKHNNLIAHTNTVHQAVYGVSLSDKV